MKISIVTPAEKQSKNGNRTTAVRWARMLRELGHQVRIDVDYRGEVADVMIAIHAWRSADAILRYRERYAHGPLVVGLGGTDVNTFLKTHPEPTLRSMKLADALICLHDLIGNALPKGLRHKLHVVRQSALPLSGARTPAKRHFDICVIGHLRDEKDPFRTARAARLLPEASRIRVIHLGKAHTPEFAKQARSEMDINPRYHWLGEVGGWRVRREFAKTHLMVISSNQEGGANVVSEAIAANVPVIASDIDGNVGLLGSDYPGLYPVRDEAALAVLLQRAESDPRYLKSLERCGRKLKPLFQPGHERAALKRIVNSVLK
ncbi:MAG: TIGR04348 family glycosyltransferase [Rhodospirillales bacterium]|jgi:putative glycosyltransferase (TIGR04348 family)|nr:TIGR04348 family glycosyltransferase [Rhodospirillales bacterium]MBT5076547.1 TIGR04348 family glycosyltransferase [Rhodospirillales bacterium]MBT5114078.1 TIGR04348 family glycosyltransferase [Rhodospirillales bacterium]MBT5672606.1 TIGR04348 family glycosyltransferase [Rhodospirillales bacterium]MBT6185724.1 TIGR04348 family glycosyltransferase [Rhodospirillales bacterium]